jgi:hypothetical protein
MLGANRQWLAETEAIRIEDAGLAGIPFSFIGDDDDRRRLDAKPAADFLVERGDSFARVNQEQRGVGVPDGGFGLHAHPAGERLRVLILESGSVDDSELKPEQFRVALAPVAGHARPIVDKRQALTDKPIEQRRFSDIGAADDGDGRARHGQSCTPAHAGVQC